MAKKCDHQILISLPLSLRSDPVHKNRADVQPESEIFPATAIAEAEA